MENMTQSASPRSIAQRIRRERERAEREQHNNSSENMPHSVSQRSIVQRSQQESTRLNNLSRCIVSPPIDRRSIGQKARQVREQAGISYLASQRTHNLNISSSTSLPSIVNRHFPDDDLYSNSLGENASSSTSEYVPLGVSRLVSEEMTDAIERVFGPEDTQFDYSDISIDPLPDVLQTRHSLGRMTIKCRDCSALHWKDEQLSCSRVNTPLFGMCCLQGKIQLPLLSPLPPALLSLYEGSNALATSFRENIRSYNASNAFTSLGVQMDDRILTGIGPTSFTIHGELHHRIGSLLPNPGTQPSYAQLYVYDPATALRYREFRNPHLRSDVLRIINSTLLESNELCRLYRRAFEVLVQFANDINAVPVSLRFTPGSDRRRCNLPTTSEIAVILPGDGSAPITTRDIILRSRPGPLRRISECHPLYWPSHYVLFFPRGDLGWHPDMKQWNARNNCPSEKRLTQLQYYAYRLFERPCEYSSILRGGLLFQQFLVDSWAAYEQNRLEYVRTNQSKIRSDVYRGLTDSMGQGRNPEEIGKRFILPSSHLGSPRSMYEIYQDSMAITRYNHHPDIFLTVTANPKWPEIQNELKPHQSAFDRPDLVARVFEMKRKAIMEEIVENSVLGRVAAYVYTIEFQKRGLPHMHALIFLRHEDKIRTPTQVDRIVSAEIPDPVSNPMLFSTIMGCMIHGPCGVRNPNSPCMLSDRGHPYCRFKYPRVYVDATTMDTDGYPLYRRTRNGRYYMVRGHEVDNRDVVPHNPYLCTMFDCHINVEVCASIQAVKYIHKYIYKGYDLTTLVVGGSNDEIQQYLESRYIGPVEAAWRLFKFPMHKESPNVERLPLHLKGMHHVTFNASLSPEEVEENAASQKSKLVAFFEYYTAFPDAVKYAYPDFPQYFVWKKDKEDSRWEPRKKGFAIGRMYFAKPNEGERFYLRLLLSVVKGPPSFESLMVFESVVYDSYKNACIARGLLEDDQEWDICLREASIMQTGYQLRRLFAIVLVECSPLHPDRLWNKYALQICDDLPYRLQISFGIEQPTDDQIKDYGLFMLEKLLLQSGNTLSNFPPMPLSSGIWSDESVNRLISEQLRHRFLISEEDTTTCVNRLNTEQRYMYDVVADSVYNDRGKIFFLNGAAGTGKTFVYNTIAASCRHAGHISVLVASSGIASLLLSGGRTAHSTFKLPLDIMENSVCGFTKQSMHAELFRQTDLIIWDEVTMQHRHCIEAVDRTLQDIRGNTKPFGGITVVLGGDFRQTLPIVTKGVQEQIVGATVSRSLLWENVQVLNLVQNMRLNTEDLESVGFVDFLKKVGTISNENLELPANIKKCADLMQLLHSVYPALNVGGIATSSFLRERTILAPRNDEVKDINRVALEIFPGEFVEYLSADNATGGDFDMPHLSPSYTIDALNRLDPSSLPPFRLRLKVGSPIMLLRNIAPRDGLCNGTRLIVEHCATRVIEARILTGDKAGTTVFIPRITLSPTSSELAIPMSRRQFPIRLAFAMTINKSQGQSVKYVGIDLRTPVFSHGQLYVALSRCTSALNISVILPSDACNCTVNIVYPEVLL